jgi:hypothetical protein
MGKSARILGLEFGRTAREMNALLREYNYLDGSPGAYGLTEKGQQFGEEQYNDNGYGGYAYRGWETRTWNEETADALRADMEANPDGLCGQESPAEEDTDEYEPSLAVYAATEQEGDGPPLTPKELAIAGAVVGVVVGAIASAPHLRRVWNNKAKPAARRVRTKFTKQKPPEAQPAETTEDPE